MAHAVVAFAHKSAHEGFAGECYAVHKVGEEDEQLHYQCVDGEGEVAAACAYRHERQCDQNHAEAAHEDVTVDGGHSLQLVPLKYFAHLQVAE